MGFDETILYCSSPSLCGIKPASLFTMKNALYKNGSEKICELNNALKKKNISILPIQKKNYMLLFVYNKVLLKNLSSIPYILSSIAIRNFFTKNANC